VRCSRAALAWVAALALLVAAPALAEEKPPVPFRVTVLHASPESGGVARGAERFDRLLRDSVRYESLRVLESRREEVRLNEIGRVEMPAGRAFRFRPIGRGDRGVLVAIDWETRGDFRLRRGRPLVIGGLDYQGGKLVVVLEAE
jgi:hypothetical protein